MIEGLQSFGTIIKLLAVFFLLESTLWFVMMTPNVTRDLRWTTETLFQFTKLKTCMVNMFITNRDKFESIYISMFGLIGIMLTKAEVPTGELFLNPPSSNLFSALGSLKKAAWLLITPWIISFIYYWCRNYVIFVVEYSDPEITDTHNATVVLGLMLTLFFVETLVCGEVVSITLAALGTMNSIHSQAHRWERVRREFENKSLIEIFGREAIID